MELDKEFWPCAMKHACFQHNARQMGTKVSGVKFGSVVWMKSKKDRGPFDPRWERGKYMGPADDVREGHVVRLDDGLWLRTLHKRTVRDDGAEFEVEEHIVDLIEPTRRVRGKTKLRDPELRAIRKQERSVIVKELLESKIWDSPQAKVERPQMREGEVWDGAAYINLGAYQHGGITSITKATEKFNKEAVLAARLLTLDHPKSSFTSVALVKNAVMPVHRDSFNHKRAMNLISHLSRWQREAVCGRSSKSGTSSEATTILASNQGASRSSTCSTPRGGRGPNRGGRLRGEQVGEATPVSV